jgi:hypothetical protein
MDMQLVYTISELLN